MAPNADEHTIPPAVLPDQVQEEKKDSDSSPPIPTFDRTDIELHSAVTLPPSLSAAISAAVSKKSSETKPNADLNSNPNPNPNPNSNPNPNPDPTETLEFPSKTEESVPTAVILAFVNARSGGRLGFSLLQILESLIGPSQVFDLSKMPPGDVLTAVASCLRERGRKGDVSADLALERVRVMVAGGDGTAGWLMSAVMSANLEVPVAVVPLGTGNDLARSFGWGTSAPPMTKKALRKRLLLAAHNPIKKLDSWRIVVVPAGSVSPAVAMPHAMLPHQHVADPLGGGNLQEAAREGEREAELPPAFAGTFYNYFSMGMDAQIAYGFHHLREGRPWLARGRLANQIIYSGFGCGQGWFCTGCSVRPHRRSVSHVATVYVRREPEGEWEELFVPVEVRALIVLNLQSYAGGRNPWGQPSENETREKKWERARTDDGRVEVVGLRGGWHTAIVMGGGKAAMRLAQAYGIRIELRGGERGKAYMQLDGEPWQQPLSEREETVVEITPLPQSRVVEGERNLEEGDKE